MSYWSKYSFASEIKAILKESDMFLSPYQIAIKLNNINPLIATDMGVSIGGLGTGVHKSLSKYISTELANRIKSGDVKNIECGFMSSENINDLNFYDNKSSIHISAVVSNGRISMFRYINIKELY